MLKTVQKRKSEGFTIIEVLIVLAIVGLIMVVVFLAVPALQRSARNNALNTDANDVYTGVSNWVSNNNGTLPTGASLAGNVVTITGPAGSNTETVKVDANVSAIKAAVLTSATSGAISKTDPVGTLQIVSGAAAKCNDTASGLAGGGSSRGVALLYVAESGSGNIVKCLD